MAIDNDLAALMPQPPPPRPARREAALEEALRRFDAGGQQMPSPPVGARVAPARGAWGRAQVAALASVALVVLVSVPIWWSERERIGPQIAQVSSPVARDPSREARAAEPQASRQAEAKDVESSATEQAIPVAPSEHAARPGPVTVVADAAPAPVAPAEVLASSEAPAPASARPAPPPPPPPAAPAAAVGRAAVRADAGSGIVVTGSRVERQNFESASPVVRANEKLVAAGDWNACTLRDPGHDLDACRAITAGARDRAVTQLADGLSLGWQGDLDRAIGAFDRAIGEAPDFAIAYLNRGLAWQAKGDLRRALADFNRAVARDPASARGYYHRSLLQRARGDTAPADADARRALAIDPAYQAVLP